MKKNQDRFTYFGEDDFPDEDDWVDDDTVDDDTVDDDNVMFLGNETNARSKHTKSA